MAKKQSMSKAQIAQIRQALGVGDDVPDSDIEALAKNKAFLSKVQAQGQGPRSLIGDIQQFFGEGAKQFVPTAQRFDTPSKFFNALGAKQAFQRKPPDPKTGKGGAGTGKNATTTPAANQFQQAYEQAMETLAGNAQFQGETALANQNAAVTNAVDQELGAAGASSGSPAVAAAMGAYANAYSTGEGLNSAAYTNMAASNAQYVAGSASPYAALANLLTQNVGSTYYKQLPPYLIDQLPQNVRQQLAQAGVTMSSPSGGSGGQPIPTGKTVPGANSANSTIPNFASIVGTGAGNNSFTTTGPGGANSGGNASNVTQ